MKVVTMHNLMMPTMVAGMVLGAGASFAQWVEDDVEVLLEIQGNSSQEFFWWTIVTLGDVDDDGTPDYLVSAVFNSQGAASAGKIFAYSGATGNIIWTKIETLQSSIFGFVMETLDDVDGDGITDVIVGAPFNGPTGGRAWLLSGADGSVIHIFNPNDDTSVGFGMALAVGGDFDGDGSDDIAIAEPGNNDAGDRAGRVYVFDQDGSIIATFDGDKVDGEFGIGLAFVGDVNGDGRDDLVAGERLDDFWGGLAHVHAWDGNAVQRLYTVENVGMGYNLIGDKIDGGMDFDGDGVGDFSVGDMFLGEIDLFSGATGDLIYTIAPPNEATNLAPHDMIEDVTGDGVPDIIAGAWGNDDGANEAGKAYLFSGADGSVVRTMTYTVPDGDAGSDARAAGDLNGDGTMDYVLGATGGGFNGPPVGRFFVIAGIPVDSGTPADFTGFEITFGSHDGGTLASLVDSDDADFTRRSQFGFSAFERNLTEVVIDGHTDVVSPGGLAVVTEDSGDTTNMVAKIRLANVGGGLDEICEYPVTFNVDEVHQCAVGLDASSYVDGKGNLQVRVKYVAPATFTPLGFTAGLDMLQLLVN